MKNVIALMFLSVFIMSNFADADLLTGVTVSSVSSQNTEWANEVGVNTINGSGFNPVTGVHDMDAYHMWQATTADTQPVIIWDLRDESALDTMKVWNYNFYSGVWYDMYYGARNVDIYVSTDSDPATATWTLVISPTLSKAPDNPSTTPYNTPNVLSINRKARLVKMVIRDTYMASLGWWSHGGGAGLSEVQFLGTPMLINDVTIRSVSSQVTDWANEVGTNTINGSGFNPVTGVHDMDAYHMWQAVNADILPVIIWDLGDRCALNTMKVWNYNYYSGNSWDTCYGARNVDIYVSTDSDPATATWTLVISPTLSKAPDDPSTTPYNTPNILAINQEARLVKMVIHDTYMASLGWWSHGGGAGLSEVQFLGIVFPNPNPVFSPGSRYISGPTKVTIHSEVEGASIYYTLNDGVPTTGSTLYTAGTTITVNNGDQLQAIAVVDGVISDVSRLTFQVPTTYNRPRTIQHGSAVVDGDLSDWLTATWIPLDVIYDTASEADVQQDVPDASYAVRWQENKVYVAVKVQDTRHYFTDSYTAWNARDAIEVFIHTDNDGPTDYSATNALAQQYEFGFKTDAVNLWATLGSGGICDLSTHPDVAKVAGRIEGQWLYYEIEITPFTYFGLLKSNDMLTSVVSDLFAGQVIGLDIDVISNSDARHLGKKSENNMTDKYMNWEHFGMHRLISMPGDANDDGMVDVGDLGILAANYGGSSKVWNQGDFNGDGLVDVGDLGILAANYGTNASNADWTTDYAKAFGTTVEDDADEIGSSICSGLGLPIITGLALMGLMLVKLEE